MMEEPEILSSESQLQGRITTLYVQLSRPSVQAALNAAIMLLAFIIFMGLVQFSTPDLPDNDGYYHIRLAYLMRTEGLKPSFPYLQLSILNVREFSDHHFLFHVALIPFTFGDLRLGAKWATVFFAGLAFLSVWWLLYRQKVPYAGLWALGLLAISEGFLFRMSIARAQSLSLAVLALGLSFLLEKRYILLAPLAFIYVWLYDAFPLIMVVASAYFMAVLLLERRLEWRPLVYTGAGILLGLLIVLMGDLLGGFWFVIIGIFLRSSAEGSYQQVLMKSVLQGVKVKELMSRTVTSVVPSLAIHRLVEDYFLTHQHVTYPVTEGQKIVGIITLKGVKEIPREQWMDKTVRDVMIPIREEIVLDPEGEAVEALQKMIRT